jgi:hypothetical protein
MPWPRTVALVCLLLLGAVAGGVRAESKSASLQVSVTVTRACQVSGSPLSVLCAGTGPSVVQVVQVALDDDEPTLAALSPMDSGAGYRSERVAGAPVRTLTINF